MSFEKLTKEKEMKLIADAMRSMGHDTDGMSDADVVESFGGDTSNEIIAQDGEERYLYRSIDSCITVYLVINAQDMHGKIVIEQSFEE